MINPRFVLRLSLLAVLLTACAPATSAIPTVQATLIVPTATVPAPAETVDISTQTTASTEATAPTALPIATSRGPNLEATDPTMVKLASGGLQLVEFFEFWWTTCQQMAPMVHGLEAKYFGKIKFSYLEISNPQTEEFRNTLGFKYRPSFYLVDRQGNILHQWLGYQTQEQFEEVFTKYVQ